MSDDLISCKWIHGLYVISIWVGDYEIVADLDDGYTEPDEEGREAGLFIYYNGMDITDSFIKLNGCNIKPTTTNLHRLLEVVTAHSEEQGFLADREGGIA